MSVPSTSTFSAPGKLVIAGEWAVLSSSNHAIVAAVDRRCSVSLTKNTLGKVRLNLPGFALRANYDLSGRRLEADSLSQAELELFIYLESTINTFQDFYPIEQGFDLETASADLSYKSPDQRLHKLGFGSSAGIIVATTANLLKHFGQSELGTGSFALECFKISALAHAKAQGAAGSGFDLAAAVYGGVSLYSKPDKSFSEIKSLDSPEWAGLRIEQVSWPADFSLLIVFSGNSASTKNLLADFKLIPKARYTKTFESIEQNTLRLAETIAELDLTNTLACVRENQNLLDQFASETGLNILTPRLAKIISLSSEQKEIAAKIAGAGGGDCALVICKKTQQMSVEEQIDDLGGVYLINAQIDCRGVSAEA